MLSTGAPIEGQEVSEADLLGKINDDDEDDEEKSLSRSGEEDSLDVGKRLTQHDDDLDPAKKKQKKDDGTEGPELESKADKKLSNMRRNIREVMDETQLDEATLSAQRQEMERLRRVQEQQRIIREVHNRRKGVALTFLETRPKLISLGSSN
jgi:RAD54-like protein 2